MGQPQSLPARLAWRLNYKADVQGCTRSFTVQQAIVALQWLVLLLSTLINFILDGDELLGGADMQVGSHMGLSGAFAVRPFLRPSGSFLVHVWRLSARQAANRPAWQKQARAHSIASKLGVYVYAHYWLPIRPQIRPQGTLNCLCFSDTTEWARQGPFHLGWNGPHPVG